MPTHKFSIKEAIKFGWNVAINHIGFFVVMLLVSGVILVIPQSIANSDSNIVSTIGSIIAGLLSLVIGLGYIKVSLKFLDGGEAGLSDFMPTQKHFWAFLLGSVICMVIVGLGFVALIIPGIILGVLLGVSVRFFPFYIVEKNLGAVESLKASWNVTKGSRWDIFKLLVVDVLVIIAGALLLGVGLFLAIPTVMMSQAYVYRKLTSSSVVATEVA